MRRGSAFLFMFLLLLLPGLGCGLGFALVAGDTLETGVNTIALGVRDMLHLAGLTFLLLGVAAVLAALGWSAHRLVDAFFGIDDRLVDPRTGMGIIVRKQGLRKFTAFIPHRAPGPVVYVKEDNAHAPAVTDDRDLRYLAVETGGHVDAVRAAAGGRTATPQVIMPPTGAPPPSTPPRVIEADDLDNVPIVRPSVATGDEEDIL